jgi:acetyl/propionyl-CoA carboxylase alpha subunit
VRIGARGVKYFVQVGADEHVVEIDGDQLTYDGVAMNGHAELIAGTPIHKVTIGNEVHCVIARRGAEKGDYDISLGGFRLALQALDERSRVIRDLSGNAKRETGPAHLMAPMPGLIVRIGVTEGDQVHPGQGLIVMEAMKMENELRATRAGKVKRVACKVGAAVEKGALLLEMED